MNEFTFTGGDVHQCPKAIDLQFLEEQLGIERNGTAGKLATGRRSAQVATRLRFLGGIDPPTQETVSGKLKSLLALS